MIARKRKESDGNMKKKRLALAIGLLAILIAGVAYGALLTYYGTIKKTVVVQQAVLLDGFDYTQPIIETLEPEVAGATICQLHYIENIGAKPALIDWNYVVEGPGTYPGVGVEVLVLASVNEEYSSIGEDVEATVVKTWECSTAMWVVDIISDDPAHGTYGVGLAISLDGVTPSFQVWYAEYLGESADWLYQKYPWDSPVVPVSEVSGISATGAGILGEKHFEISIDCEYLCGAGATYYWAMQLRTNLITWIGLYDWGPDASGFLVNHAGVPIVFPYTLEAGERLDFNLAFNLDINLLPGTYTITTTFVPA